jgi:hypothetical protein
MCSSRKRARDRRLERRLARKVTKTGQKCAPEIYEAYLAGLQKGLEVQEEQQAALQCMSYRDIFGNEVSSMKMRTEPVDDSIGIGTAVSPSLSFH